MFDATFSISSFIWLVITIGFSVTFGIYVKKHYFDVSELDKYLNRIKKYLKETYPQIEFNFNRLETYKDSNIDTLKILIVDNIIEQFVNIEFKPVSKSYLKANEIWNSYSFYSIPSSRYNIPPDWIKRKEAVYKRENGFCQRCKREVVRKESDIILNKEIKDGGDFSFENLSLVCIDCKKIILSLRKNEKVNYLPLREKLLDL